MRRSGSALLGAAGGPRVTPGLGLHRVLNGIVFRVRTGIPWRDLPEHYGPWQTVYKRFARWQSDGTWARIEACVHTQADVAGKLDWDAQIDATVVRGGRRPSTGTGTGCALRARPDRSRGDPGTTS